MALTKNPKLALIPSGYKASKVYSVLPSDGVGDFDFSRSGQATRVNKDGLIETVDSNVPRLNYPMIDGVVSGCPSLLLEPQRTNIVEYSEDVTQWNDLSCTVSLTTDSTSPSGQSSVYKVNDNANDAQHRVDVRPSVTSGTEYTFSVFVKKPSDSDIDFAYLLFASKFSTTRFYFNIAEGTSLDTGGTIIDYGNGWYRLSASATANSSGNGTFGVNLTDAYGNNTYSGTGNGSMYFWGGQAEPNSSYPTSYIPTSGSSVTRVAETANGAGDANTFNDSEGVLYAEISALADDGTSRRISLSHANADTDNRVTIEVDETARRIKAFMSSGGTTVGSLTAIVDSQTHNNKVALIYKENTFNIYVNGFLLDTNPSIASLPIGLSRLQFEGANGSNPFYGKAKQIQYFDSALNDSDLETLTSWTSFNEMATSQLYTIQ